MPVDRPAPRRERRARARGRAGSRPVCQRIGAPTYLLRLPLDCKGGDGLRLRLSMTISIGLPYETDAREPTPAEPASAAAVLQQAAHTPSDAPNASAATIGLPHARHSYPARSRTFSSVLNMCLVYPRDGDGLPSKGPNLTLSLLADHAGACRDTARQRLVRGRSDGRSARVREGYFDLPQSFRNWAL